MPTIDTRLYCEGCGQRFRRTLRRASEEGDELTGRHQFCLGCHIQDYRAAEVFDEPLDSEADTRAAITARRDAVRAGWRFVCDRVAPRRRAFLVTIVRPDGTAAEVIGAPGGLGASLAQRDGERRMLHHAAAARD